MSFYDDDFDEVGMTATEMLEALRGDFGPEAQAAALNAAGIEFADDDGYDGYDEDADWAREFVAEQIRLEQALGRQLTGKEIDALAQDHMFSGQPPDLFESFARVTGRSGDLRNKEERQAVATEAFEEAEALKRAESQITEEGAGADSQMVQAMNVAMDGAGE